MEGSKGRFRMTYHVHYSKYPSEHIYAMVLSVESVSGATDLSSLADLEFDYFSKIVGNMQVFWNTISTFIGCE